MKNQFNKSGLLAAFSIATALVLSACAPTPTLDTSDASAMTHDGLYPVAGSRADAAWARPDVDWTQYSTILLEPVGIEYRPGGESGRTMRARSDGGPYVVTDEQKKRLESTVVEAFRTELARSERFDLVDSANADTLLIRAALLDIVSYVPPDTMSGLNEVYLSRVGEATLVLEIRDATSNAILARSVDRRAAGDEFQLQESNRVRNTSEVRRLASSWARSLRTSLEDATAQ